MENATISVQRNAKLPRLLHRQLSGKAESQTDGHAQARAYERSERCPDFASAEIFERVAAFHQSLPGYAPTPLIRLSSLARSLGIDGLYVKDESQRFDLRAFKVLGASYAMAQLLCQMAKLPQEELSFHRILAERALYKNTTFVTATDGNHGRAVAWCAQRFGCGAVVYLPRGSSVTRVDAIRKLGAKASIFDGNYDEAVQHAARQASETGWILLQDTAWEDYQEIPTYIMQGYATLMSETFSQIPDMHPTHVFVQAGVGSLAAGLLAYLLCQSDRQQTALVVVEAQAAPCIYQSVVDYGGLPHKITGDFPTIMAGLACGEPSHLALELLNSDAHAFCLCSDEVSRMGMKLFANPLPGDTRIISGESGAVTLGLVVELLHNTRYRRARQELGLAADSRVLLFSTEGDTGKPG